jgi:vacuolar-type H+-ATPase catalytic subunit A/Vma1
MAVTEQQIVGKLVRIAGPMIEAEGMLGVSMGEILVVGKLG